jgi:hypothetical protein
MARTHYAEMVKVQGADAGGCKDLAPDGTANRRAEPTATRLQQSAQRWPTQRLRWVNGQNGNNSEGVEAELTAKYAKYANGNSVFIFAWFAWFAVKMMQRLQR